MKMHKKWNEVSAKHLSIRYNKLLGVFAQLSEVIQKKQLLNLTELTNYYAKAHSKSPLSGVMVGHLLQLNTEFNNLDDMELQRIQIRLSKVEMPRFYEEVKALRQGFLCSSCNYENHGQVNGETRTVVYRRSFCEKLVGNFLPVLSKKYRKLFSLLLILDEWAFLTSGRHLMSSATNRAIYRRYINIIKKCQERPLEKDSQQFLFHCAQFCREFNLNKFTFMFDGELGVVQDYLRNFDKFFNLLDSNKAKYFKQRSIDQWSAKDVAHYQKYNSVLNKKIFTDPARQGDSKNSFDLHFKGEVEGTHTLHRHEVNDVEVNSLMDDVDSTRLFETNTSPINLSRFDIQFSRIKGIDVFEDMKGNNFSISKDGILAMIHFKHIDNKNLDEVIQDNVEKVLVAVKIKNIASFQLDWQMRFKSVKTFLSHGR